jgi:murein L,D-transpeptidase YcbB/YkuD
MARAAGAGLPVDSGRPYDQGLWELVTAFQEARALEPDGVVDRETAMVLRRAEWGPDVPRLSARME